MRLPILLTVFVCLTGTASAGYPANKPCSGKKGGISHCMGQYFICRDGTTSQSKKDCRVFLGLPADGSDDRKPRKKTGKD